MNKMIFFSIWLLNISWEKNYALNDLISIWNIRLLYKKNCVKTPIDIFDRKNVLANFLNGPISKNSFLISKIFYNKVMVIIFILIGMWHDIIGKSCLNFSFITLMAYIKSHTLIPQPGMSNLGFRPQLSSD